MNSSAKKFLIIILLLFFSSVILLWETSQTLGQHNQTNQIDQRNRAKVVKVVDGDTIEVDNQGSIRKLRYIGINTPETVDPRKAVECFGKEASLENKRLIEGKEIQLEGDVSETDRYGRILRYVYLKLEDGKTLFVNDYLVREGFAYAYSYPPDVKYSQRFIQAEKDAKENRRGLWAKCPR